MCEHPAIDNTTNCCVNCGENEANFEWTRPNNLYSVHVLDPETQVCVLCGASGSTLITSCTGKGVGTPQLPTHKQHNVGESNYADHAIQPWDIWKEYDLNPWDADVIKRILRTKKNNDRVMDYRKIIHICEERIHQIEVEGLE